MGKRKSALGHSPGKKWAFDERVAACFPDMLARSVPNLEEMRRLVFDLGRQYLRIDGGVIDVGASVGDGLAPFVAAPEQGRRTYVAIDSSPDMVDALERRKWPKTVDIYRGEAGREATFPGYSIRGGFDVALCVLTLQFVPTHERPRALSAMHRALRPGGVIFLVEKVAGDTARTEAILSKAYEARKVANGFTQKEVDAKRESLRGVMNAVSARENERMLRAAGFRHVELFWASLNFRGWFAEKRNE